MKPRQRVLTALSHQEADRVPLALCGGSYGIVDDLYLRLLKMLRLGDPVPPFRSGHNISYMDDRLLEVLGVDMRYCWPGLLPNSPITPGEDADTFYDTYGQSWKRTMPYFSAGAGLLSESDSLDDIETKIKWPDAKDPRWTAGLAQRARTLRENTDYFVVMRMVTSHGPFQTACDFRGTENFLMDLSQNPDYAHILLERITDSIEGLLRGALACAGTWLDMIELPGDDYAGNTNLILSPRMFRQFIAPCLTRLLNVVKETCPHVKVMLHSDGAITKLIPDIIALGVDVIHPLETLAATDMPAIKAEFGSQVTFLGGIDISHAMPGSIQDVIAEARRRISILAPGGGYILAPSNHLQADIPTENVIALFEEARKSGVYPIKIESAVE